MKNPLTLRDSKFTVTFTDYLTRKAHKALTKETAKGYKIGFDGEEMKVQDVDIAAMEEAIETVFPLLVKEVTRDGKTFDPESIFEEISQYDFVQINQAVNEMQEDYKTLLEQKKK